jgi:hypothetical protein
MTSDKMRLILGSAIVVLMLATMGLLKFVDLSGPSHDAAMMVIGAVVVQFANVYSYFFGSSDGSKKKDDIIASKPN